MLQKRRLTVQSVDAAHFCGWNNDMVVSFLNGVDHLVVDPAASDQEDAQPLPSRVLAHTYTGAQLADVAVDTQRECVIEAAISSAAVVACRVTPLTASKADPTAAYPVRTEGPTKIVFFSGCQRLAEVRLGTGLAAGADAADTDAVACPMQCFRVESCGAPGSAALDIAAFMEGPNTLCTCTPQLGKLQTIRFDEQRVCCMGSGRVGKAEVTVVLSSGVAVLCGVLQALPSASSSSWVEEEEEGEEAAFDAEQRQQAPTSAAGSASLTAAETAATRRAFAAANERSNLCILHTVQLPPRAAAALSSTPDVPAAAALLPLRVAWTGASTLWVVYEDGSVVAVQCSEVALASDATLRHDAQQNEESQERHAQPVNGHAAPPVEPTMRVKRVLHTQLTDADGMPIAIQQLCTNADPRAPVLHVAFTSAAATTDDRPSQLFYGTARVGGADTASLSLQWRLQWIPYDEQLYGVRFERGQFHVLTQGCRGGGPLFIAKLPCSLSVHTPHADAATTHAGLAATIMASPESELANHCSTCETILRELHLAAQQLSREDDAEALLHELMEAQHALYALLSRQHQSLSVTDLAPSESLPYRLLQRASRLHRQLCAYVLLLRLGVVHTVTEPMRDVLRIEEAAAISKVAQAQWTTLMRDTFRSASLYQSAVSELAMWQSPTPLCVELLLSQLGLSLNDASCTMAAVLSKMDTLTTEYALLILYYSYQVMGCAGDTGNSAPSYGVQQQQHQWRESFLLLFGHSVELNVWAFACYAVDHGFNPTEQQSDSEAASDAAPLYVLGGAVHHLGTPPFTKLLAPVINGLAHVAALDALLHLVPSCLAVYAAAGENVPLSVSMRLLCVAVRAGSHCTIEALYDVMRPSPLLRDVAAQPLAFAALAARDVSGLRGWVEVGSPVAGTIERTLEAAENIHQRESVLIAYYILLQRYEDALRMCTAATAADATQAQRLHVVLSYLRSLLSVSASSSSAATEKETSVAACAPNDVDPLLPLDSTVLHPWSQTSLAAPTLETISAALLEELKRAAPDVEWGSGKMVAADSVVSTAAATSAHPRHGTGGVVTSAPPNPRPPLFRPSTLLMSVERGASSSSLGSTANQVSGL